MHRPLALTIVLLATVALGAGCGSGSVPDLNAGPVIGTVTPASGGIAGGTFLTIEGTNLINPAPGAYQVLIGGQPASDITVVDSTEVTCMTPANTAGPADVTIVTVEGDGTAPGGFTFHPAPTITSITPDSGTRDGGTPVTIEGTGFMNNDPGVTIPLIDLKVLTSPVVVSDTQITGLTPPSWLEVAKDVTVRNRNGEATKPGGFLYTGPLPIIISLTPTEGPRAGGTPVTVTGLNFTVSGGELKVQFGGAQASNVNRVDDQTLTCISPLSTISGWVSVAVENNNGSTSSDPPAGGFYYIPPPEITSIVPNTGSIAGGESVQIFGSGYTAAGAGTTAVSIGGTAATNVLVVNDGEITCDTPASGGIGAVDVVVLNGNGVATLSGGYTYTAPCTWESNFGTNLNLSDDSGSTQSLGISFVYYGVTQTSTVVVSNGDLQFTTSPYYYNYGAALQNFPQVGVLMGDLNPGSGGGVYARQMPDRFVATYSTVPQFGAADSNTGQAQLTNTGLVCIIYQAVAMSPRVCINPGSGYTAVNVNLSSGYTGGGSSDALTEAFGSFDLASSFIVFVPNVGGGYDQLFFGFVP